ncbi:MAG TPA: M64 family metallopeptidase, partial [Vicinamibacteria bacterium]
MRDAMLISFLIAAAVAPPATLRLDYFHTGDAHEERFALDSVVREGPWPGPPDGRIDDTQLGRYLVEVRDGQTDEPLFSRGFASIFGEWESTPEASALSRGFHESVRFPEPRAAVTVAIKKRDARGVFRPAWSVKIDPAGPAIDRRPPPGLKVWAVMKSGEPADKVDLLLLGDGYTAAEMEKWHRDARRLADTLFAVSPFKEHRADFNVWAADTPSQDSGISRPSDGIYRRTALGATYDAFGSERYVLSFDNRRLREVAAASPYEFIEIVANDRKYGGGGIHGLYATVAADNAFTPYVFVHEFGHHFAGLADEYYTSPVAYQAAAERAEPWEPNATADPQAAKWRDLLSPGVPRPTPWPKEEFE